MCRFCRKGHSFVSVLLGLIKMSHLALFLGRSIQLALFSRCKVKKEVGEDFLHENGSHLPIKSGTTSGQNKMASTPATMKTPNYGHFRCNWILLVFFLIIILNLPKYNNWALKEIICS